MNAYGDCEMGRKNLKEIVYDSILESIYSSEFRPNEIITESGLIKKFGFSKSPVREALTALCHEGVLHNIPRCGYQVIAMTTEDVEQMMEYRRILETGMMRINMAHITDTDLKKLKELAVLCSKETEDVMEHWVYNVNFHLTLASVTENEYVTAQLNSCLSRLWRAYAQLHWNKWNHYSIPADMKYHEQIIAALKRNDLEEAVACLEKDLEDFGLSS